MTGAEMLTWFDILQDKFNTPYFTDLEKYNFLNDSQINYINDYLNINSDSEPPVFEENALKNTIIAPLLVEDVSVASASTGIILFTAIETALDTKYSLSGSKLLHILGVVENASGDAVAFVRHGEMRKQEDNEFVAAGSGNRKYRLSRGQITMIPTGVLTYLVTAIKMPVDISASVASEMPLITHRKIVAKALVKTGFVTEHQALTLMDEQTE